MKERGEAEDKRKKKERGGAMKREGGVERGGRDGERGERGKSRERRMKGLCLVLMKSDKDVTLEEEHQFQLLASI